MSTETIEASLTPAGELEKIAMTYASLLLVAVQQALRASGTAKDPERLAELEKEWASGAAGLGVYVQGDDTRLYISAVAIPASPLQDPFPGNAFRVVGPRIFSRADLEALGEATQAPRREAMN